MKSVSRTWIWNEVRNAEKMDPVKVFEQFYKADEARRRTSSGPGLSIAKELIQKMQGEISANLDAGQLCVECVFKGISLPVAKDERKCRTVQEVNEVFCFQDFRYRTCQIGNK